MLVFHENSSSTCCQLWFTFPSLLSFSPTSYWPPYAPSLDFYLSASHLSSGVSMGAEAETLILCLVAMDCPRESMQLIAACLGEVYHLRPGERPRQCSGTATSGWLVG